MKNRWGCNTELLIAVLFSLVVWTLIYRCTREVIGR